MSRTLGSNDLLVFMLYRGFPGVCADIKGSAASINYGDTIAALQVHILDGLHVSDEWLHT